ncbi:MAG: hypothetical protein V8Q93_13135, partial [Blautia faecis]
NDSRIFYRLRHAFYALSFAVKTRKGPELTVIFDIYAIFPEWSLIPGPLCSRFSSNRMMELLLIRQLAHGRKLSAHTAAERRRKSEIVFLFRFFYSNKSRPPLQRNSVVKFSHNSTLK